MKYEVVRIDKMTCKEVTRLWVTFNYGGNGYDECIKIEVDPELNVNIGDKFELVKISDLDINPNANPNP